MGYWEGSVPPSSFDWRGLTHVGHVAVLPNADGSLLYICKYYHPCTESQLATETSTLIQLAHANNVQVVLQIANTAGMRWLGATNKSNLSTFVKNIVRLVNTYAYDGVDIDWEQSLNYAQMSALLSALRTARQIKLLVADVGRDDNSFWAKHISKLDRINAMTYDGAGNWNRYSWFNSALYSDPCACVWSIDVVKRHMLAAGIPAAKLNLGIPFYGYVSIGGGVTGPRQSNWRSPSLSQINYNQLSGKYNLLSPNWDEVAQVPWITTSNGWITFDDARSVARKVNYIQKSQLGGWIIWSLDKDYFPAQIPQHPLLAAITTAMKKSPSARISPSFNAGDFSSIIRHARPPVN